MEPPGGAATRKQTQDLPTHTVLKVTENKKGGLACPDSEAIELHPSKPEDPGRKKKKKNSLKEEKRHQRGKVIESSDYESQL